MLGANAKRRAWLTPNQMTNAGIFCRRLFIPDDPDLIAAVSGALYELTLDYNWQQHGTMEPGEAARLMRTMLFEYFDSDGCDIDATFWDDEDGDDADGEDSDLDTGFPWYEDVADWIVTAFLASAFTPDAAIAFTTTIRKIRLTFRRQQWGALFNVFVDDLLVASGDSYSETPDLLEMDLDLDEVAPAAFRAQASPARTIKIVHTGTANPNAISTDKGFGLEVVRKNLRQPELNVVYGDEPPTFQRLYDDFERIYGVPMTIPFDIRINGCELEKTTDGETWVSVGDLSECATGASVELRTTETHIQWRQDDDSPSWTNLIALDELKGADGQDGTDGQDGDDGLTFTSVNVATLAPGTPATGAVTSGVLQLGIPQGAQGLQGVQGVQGATGATGAQGAKGDPGDCGEDCVNGEPVAITEAEDTSLCAGAVGLTDYVLTVMNYSLNEIDNAGGNISSANFLLGFLDGIETVAKAIPYVEDAVEWLTLARDVGTGIVRSQINNPDYREQVFCSLYCTAKAAGGAFNEAVFNAWLNALPAVTGSAHYDDMARRILGWAKCSQRFFMYAQGSSAECELCTDCEDEEGDWCYQFNTFNGWTFLQQTGGSEVFGVLDGGSARHNSLRSPVNSGSYHRRLDMTYGFTSSSVITRVEIDYTLEKGSTNVVGATSPGFQVKLGATQIALDVWNTAQQGSINFVWNGEMTATSLQIVLSSYIGPTAAYSGSCRVHRVRISGTGVNPFGISNC